MAKVVTMELPGAKRVSLEQAEPKLGTARGKLAKLQAERDRAEARIAEINGELASHSMRRADRVTVEAQRLLAGSGEESETSEASRMAALREESDRLREHRQVLDRAIELQRREIDELECRASQAVCRDLLPDYRQRVEAVARAMIDLGDAWLALLALREQLREAGVRETSYLHQTFACPTGDPHDATSRMAWWLQDAAGAGLIDPKMIPAEWRKAWER